ncbi:hypothetical protein AQJ67_06295 [Streptomyces caeruleatus]|uniref:DUF6777 domain-containing protein n=1 Tax=Streptomyces caeruleatus TaxID=661399 RepID=A0A101U7H6_9ACTN|nr:hypothetical protein AQJ67_06295 [Streptomyces caeruleatus]
MLSTVVVAAVVLAVVLSRGTGGTGDSAQGEVFLQAAGSTGPDPFTESTATDSSAPPVTPSPATESAPSNAVIGVDGGAPGLYGGTRNVASCDVEKQIKYLQQAPEKNRAFASVAGVEASDVPSYLRSLTPVQLRMDTRVTNHGYRDGAADGYQAVLQTGTAVLVDDHGVPRVRCACGNPLTEPVARQGTLKQKGDSWPAYRPSNVVVVTPAPKVVKEFVIYDHDHDEWVARHRGDDAHKDKKTKRPVKPSPSVSVSKPTSPSSSTSTTPTTPSTKDEPTKDKTPKDKTPKDKTPKDETTKDETTKDETTKDETTKDETTKDEPTTDEPTSEEPTTEPESPETTTSSQEPPDEEMTTESQSTSGGTPESSPPL